MEAYRQTTQYTGAASGLLIALHRHDSKEWPLDREHEFLIWMNSTNLPTRSSSIYGLAIIAKKAGMPVKVVVGEREYDYPDYRFKRYKKVEIDDAKYTSKLHSKQARQAGVEIEEREFSLQEVKDLAAADKLILLRVNAGIFRENKATSRYVLVHGIHKNGSYLIMDPQQGKLTVDEETMHEAFDTLATKKKRDHRMLVLG